MTAQPQTHRLPDGRILAFREYGDPKGFPVILFHGIPGSSIWFMDNDPVSLELGIRCICPERPGYGISDFTVQHSFLNYVDDIEQLAAHCGLDQFAVIGVSGGGAFAAACAFKLTKRVLVAGLVSSTSSADAPNAYTHMTLANRIGFSLAKYLPMILYGIYGLNRRLLFTNPQRYFDEIEAQFCEGDKLIINRPEIRTLLTHHLQAAFAKGVKGAVHEMKLQVHPWGFRLSEIHVPVHIWHGEEDTLAPYSMGEYLSQNITNSIFHPVPQAGHLLSDDPVIWRQILRSVIEAH